MKDIFKFSARCVYRNNKLVIRRSLLPRVTISFICIAILIFLGRFCLARVSDTPVGYVWLFLALGVIVYPLAGVFSMLFCDRIVCTPKRIVLYKGCIPYKILSIRDVAYADTRISWSGVGPPSYHLYIVYSSGEKGNRKDAFYPLSAKEAHIVKNRINQYLQEQGKSRN